MESPPGDNTCELTGILIAPDRELAVQFKESLTLSKAFQVLVDLKTYPSRHTLEIRLRQMNPDIVLIDLATNHSLAADLIRFLAEGNTSVQVVGLSPRNDPGMLLNCLRLGASEFLYAPFEISSQREAVSRLHRIRKPEPVQAAPAGNIVAFTNAKPGSGASTIAVQAAFALKKFTGKRVLLADFDFAGGSIGFYSRLSPSDPLFEALSSEGRITPSMWSSVVSESSGVAVLTAPCNPFTGTIDSSLLNGVLDSARSNYDWVLIDLPAVFANWTLAVLSQADCGLLVSTPELPSLHLARKAVRYLDQLGFPRERFQLVINRVNRRDDITRANLERLFECTVHSRLPNDFFSLNRLAAIGEPVEGSSDLGKAVADLAARLSTMALSTRAAQAVASSRGKALER